jgi:hypothetical protein
MPPPAEAVIEARGDAFPGRTYDGKKKNEVRRAEIILYEDEKGGEKIAIKRALYVRNMYRWTPSSR